jgi:transmembrane sensor
MNGGSTLSVRMSGVERLVEMGEAEAAFDVAHDADRPFRVTVGESRIEVLGTAFDVRRDAGATRVSVTRGVVQVSDLADASRNVRLTLGQSVTRPDATGELMITPGPTEPAGWLAGQLIYDDRPLSEVVDDLNRAYPTPVRVTGGADRLRFTGVLALDGQDETLRRLESFLPVVVERREGFIELRPR